MKGKVIYNFNLLFYYFIIIKWQHANVDMVEKNQALVNENLDLKEVEGVKEVLKKAQEDVNENLDLKEVKEVKGVKEVLKKAQENVNENLDLKNQKKL
tara:strand:+ start:464 stop:757 length:294 start_codon:yes stop_codon:yes gene_type:complete